MKIGFLMVFIVMLAGCAQNQSAVKSDYVGEFATIEDTFQSRSAGSAFFYCVTKVDGQVVASAMSESLRASSGRGIYLSAVGAGRKVPAKPIKLSLLANVVHAAPIAYMTDADANDRAEGELEFTPKPNVTYFVKGTLSKKYSSIWIEDSKGNVVTNRLGTVDPSLNAGLSAGGSRVIPLGQLTKTRADVFLSVSGGESVESVVNKLGKPDDIAEVKVSFFAEPPAHDYTVYEYKNLGKLQFYGVQPNLKTVEKIIRGVQLNNGPLGFRQKIDSVGSYELRLLAKDYFVTEVPGVEYLDVIAEKIWMERNVDDPDMEDAMAYFCILLGKSANSRYKSFLAEASVQVKSHKIKRHAKKSLSLMPDVEVEQFKHSPKQ